MSGLRRIAMHSGGWRGISRCRSDFLLKHIKLHLALSWQNTWLRGGGCAVREPQGWGSERERRSTVAYA